jgi:uncharacterized membrane protein YheB (UPF0754 family)
MIETLQSWFICKRNIKFFKKSKILEDIANMIDEIIHKEEHFKGIDKIKL